MNPKNKRIAILPLMEPDEYLFFAIESVINDVDYLLFSVNEHSWGDPEIKLTKENKQWLQELIKTNPKFKFINGYWSKEHEQHNAALDYAAILGCGLVICLATDLVYGQGSVKKILDTLEFTEAEIIRSQWNVFWKKRPLCVISPPDTYTPVVALKINIRYSDICEAYGNTMTLKLEDVELFHFAFARDDEFVKKKIRMSTHAGLVKPDWYEKVWLGYKPGDTDLSPFYPDKFKSAVEFQLDKLPPKIKLFFENIGDKDA